MEYFMNVYYVYTKFAPTDLYPVQYGEENCRRGHAFGPCIRSNYLLHYVYCGKGIFRADGREYELSGGQMFLIKPGQLTYYKADDDEPWLYRWIELNGSIAYRFFSTLCKKYDGQVFSDDEDMSVGRALLDIVESESMSFERAMVKLWEFFSAFSELPENGEILSSQEHIKKAESFIKINIHKKITVSDVAKYVGIDRSYLSRLFREIKHVSPQQYILSMKMDIAAGYMKNSDISIKEAAQSVGYYDSHVFNKAFKNRFNVSPSEWREKKIWDKFII